MRRVIIALLCGAVCWAGWYLVRRDGPRHRSSTPARPSHAADSDDRAESHEVLAGSVRGSDGRNRTREATSRRLLPSDIDRLIDDMTGRERWQAVVSGHLLLSHMRNGELILNGEQQARLWKLVLPGGDNQLGAISLNILWRAGVSKEAVFERLVTLLRTGSKSVATDAEGLYLLAKLGVRDARRDAIILCALRVSRTPAVWQVEAYEIAASQLVEADFQSAEIVDALTNGLRCDHDFVVVASVKALDAGRVWNRSIQEEVLRLADSGSCLAIEVLCAYVEDGPDQTEWVRRYLSGGSAEVRTAALLGLGRGRLWNQAMAGDVGARLMDEDVYVRLEAMKCLVARTGGEALVDGTIGRFVERAWRHERAQERWEGADAFETKCAIEYLLNQRELGASIREAARGLAWDAVGEDVARALATLLYWKSGGEFGKALERLLEIVEGTEPYWLESVAGVIRRLVDDQTATVRSKDDGAEAGEVPRQVRDAVREVWSRRPIAAKRLRDALAERPGEDDPVGRLLMSD